jgi:DNA-binding GntR family transcriptional regulator
MPTKTAADAAEPKAEIEADDGKGRGGGRDVARTLRHRIQEGELKPGEWLREIRLAEELSTGRSAVREALRLLEEDGLVELEKFRGARVTTPTLYELFDLFEVRAALFGLVARFACFRAADEDIAEIAHSIDELIKGADSASAEARVNAGIEIGNLITKHASRDARDMIAASHRKARWHFSYLGLAESRGAPGPIADWRDLAAALSARNAEMAATSARRIIYFMQQEVTKALVARGTAPG